MKATMRTRSLLPMVLLACSAGLVHAQQVGINATGAAAAPSAMLDLASTTKGFLMPRMTDAQRIAIPAPANGLLVYQNNTPNPASPEGYWYYDATIPAWVPLTQGNGWMLPGNASAIPMTNYIGTSDAQLFSVRTNNTERMRIQAAGRVGIGTVAAPSEILEINGGLKITGAAASGAGSIAGTMQWNPTLTTHTGNVDNTVSGWYELENVFAKRANQPYQVATASCVAGTVTVGTGSVPAINTLQTPYSTFWEDGRHQYLWLASELTAAGICPSTGVAPNNFPITAVAFNATNAWSIAQINVEIKMKNTTTTALTNFDYGGLQLCASIPSVSPVVGWNTHTFSVPFHWNGTSNVILEYCHNNYDWNGNVYVQGSNTAFNATYGLYCDACGGTGTVPCTPTIPPNPGVGIGPCGGTNAACGGGGCCGYSMTPGCMLTNVSSLLTCDGTFQYIGSQGSFTWRPNVRFTAYSGGITITINNADYLYSTMPTMIGSATWAAGGGPPFSFKGPGTMSAENSVWGGTTLLSDYVFDKYFDGNTRPEDVHGAAFAHTPIDEMVNYVERERHLPTIDGREEWQENGMPSVDQLTNQLWVTVEEQALYIKELNERMELLQKYLVDKRLKDLGATKP